MLIQCTKKLLDEIGIKGSELAPSEGHEQFPNSLMGWHANIVRMNRRKAIILMNNESRYPVVIYGLVKKDFSNISALIRKAIKEAFRMEGINNAVIDGYMAKAGEISFSKTANRSMIAKLNNTVMEVEFWQEYINPETKIQKYMSMMAGNFVQNFGVEDEYLYPIDKMVKCLEMIDSLDESRNVDNVLDIVLYQLKIQINIDGHDIWRRVLVPSTYSFRHLHNIIQTVFDWQNYHLHEFIVDREEDKPLRIVMDDDPGFMDYLDDEKFIIQQERFVSLDEVFPDQSKIIYEYDFGDSWEHVITFEKVKKSHIFTATFLDGSGDRPPEDVGGSWGFEDYLKIIGDEENPMYSEMKKWAESQKERKFSTEQINKRLNNVVSGYRYSTYFI